MLRIFFVSNNGWDGRDAASMGGAIPATANQLFSRCVDTVSTIVALAGPEPLDKRTTGYAWVLVLGTFQVISAGPEQWINRRVLAARPMIFIGLISYPLYTLALIAVHAPIRASHALLLCIAMAVCGTGAYFAFI